MRFFLSRLSIVLYISFIPLLNILGMAVPVLFLYIEPILEHPDTDDEYESRIIRGGGWDSWEGLCRINSLASFHGDNHASSDCGFRLALDDILVTK